MLLTIGKSVKYKYTEICSLLIFFNFEVVFDVDCSVCRAASHICTVCVLMACFSPRLCKAVFVVDCVRHNELRKVVFAVGCVTCRAVA